MSIHKHFSIWAGPPILILLAFQMSAQTLDWASFRQQVIEHHPISKQAELYQDFANSALFRAKGGFDPKVYSDFNTKNFSDKTYFSYTEAGVKVPTWAGIELKGAYNLASGTYLNTESTLPPNGQASLGINWSLGQGLLYDERRTALRQAKIGLESGAAERNIILNNLLMDAAVAYWNWVTAYNQVSIYQEALRQSIVRHQALQESFLQGDKPAIDTVETYIQVQNRLLDVSFANVELQNATLLLHNFLWSKEQQPMDTSINTFSPTIDMTESIQWELIDPETLSAQAQMQHPELRLYETKLRSLHVERQLKNEKRKPVIDLNYYLLGYGWSFFPAPASTGLSVLSNDIKFGLNVNYPVFNRKARGDLQLTEIKIAQTKLEIAQKQVTVSNKVRQYANDLENLRNQITLYQRITNNYRSLLDAEIEKFKLGESSVFLINAREQRWLDAQVKFIKLVATYRKTETGLQWATGRLF